MINVATVRAIVASKDQQEQRRLIRSMSKGNKPAKAILDRVATLRQADRVGLLYPVGVYQGVYLALQKLRSLGIEKPKTASIVAYAEGVAAGVILPPGSAFDPHVRESIISIYASGIERGLIVTFESAGVLKGDKR